MNRAVSIHIGVNKPGAAPGDTRVPLADSEAAAWQMAELASQAGYDSMLVLRGDTATLAAVNAALWHVSQLLVEDDTLLVTFSGHGNKVADDDEEPGEGADEAWSLADGDLLDDTLAGYWRLFKEGVQIVVVSESCYGGGMDRGDDCDPLTAVRRRGRRMRDEPAWMADTLKELKRTCISSPPRYVNAVPATVLMITATDENEASQAGLFTTCLLEVWNGGKFRGSYCELFRAVEQRVTHQNSRQHPQIRMLGTPDMNFPLKSAFRRLDQDPGLPVAERDEQEPQDSGRPSHRPHDDPGETGTRDGRRARVYRESD